MAWDAETDRQIQPDPEMARHWFREAHRVLFKTLRAQECTRKSERPRPAVFIRARFSRPKFSENFSGGFSNAGGATCLGNLAFGCLHQE